MSSSLVPFPITEHFTKSDVHGWPDFGYGWRHQLRSLASLGFRCVAPDMRGYGRSSIYSAHGDYTLEHSVLEHRLSQ